MRNLLGGVVAAMAAVAPPVFGQAPVAVFAPATRVRIDAPVLNIQRGVMLLVAQQGDTLRLVPQGGLAEETIAVRLPDVTRLDVSQGRWPSIRRGGLIGAAAGAVVIAAVAYGVSEDPARCTLFFCNFDPRGRRMTEGGVLGAVAGGALGALVGVFVPGERWQRVLPRTP